ncbi:hypothetical protein DID88_005026 [Monilinia fructigena]|uniref:Thioesterase domain-containing protein n=1 Tax=Monilinia fructigena TaxID=38457 RepID=A0A395IQ97_9HELO|nr:hypothetical protein DID88_005026 [Monilinia fructigena]
MTTPTSSNTGTNVTDATKVEQLTSHTYSASFPDDWCIGSGRQTLSLTFAYLTLTYPALIHTQLSVRYLIGMFSSSWRIHNRRFPPNFHASFQHHFADTESTQSITLHIEFLRRTQNGPALFTVQDTKLGRQTSVLHITLSQGDRVEVVGYITHSNTSTETGVSSPHTHVLKPTPLTVSIPLLKPTPTPTTTSKRCPSPNFAEQPHKCQAYSSQNPPSPTISTNGSGSPPANLGPTSASATPATCSHTPRSPSTSTPTPPTQTETQTQRHHTTGKYWYPTLLLNIDFKKTLPTQGIEWLFIRAERKQTRNGRMDIELTAWDEEGDLVAISNHVAFFVSSERNISARVR